MKTCRLGTAFLMAAVLDLSHAQEMTVKDTNGHVLMGVTDEGTMGSIILPDTNTALTVQTDRLYNLNGSLIWNGTALGTSGSGGGWTDDGTSVRLTTGTDKVGIGDSSPTHTLDISGNIGINDIQVLYLPDQESFLGSLFLGNGGASLSHTSGDQGRFNLAAGIAALPVNTTGKCNTATGSYSLYSNTQGERNTALGSMTMFHNIDGSDNTGVGSDALDYNATGDYNTAIGYAAKKHNSIGNNNTAIGVEADVYNQAGSNNTMIGFKAGRGGTYHDKSGNIFIGYMAGANETGSNLLYIENSDSGSPLIGGDFSADEVYLNASVGIGTGSPSAALDVAGTGAIKVPVGTTAERPGTPVAGMIRLNSETGKFEGYTGSAWVDLN